MNEWNDGNVFGVRPKCFYPTPKAYHSLLYSSNVFSCNLQLFSCLYWSPIDILIHRNHQLELCKQFVKVTFVVDPVRACACTHSRKLLSLYIYVIYIPEIITFCVLTSWCAPSNHDTDGGVVVVVVRFRMPYIFPTKACCSMLVDG